MNVSPGHCLVIEDSANGVRAAVAAGMRVVGLSAASHVWAGHAEKLREAGATYLAASWHDVDGIVAQIAQSRSV